MNNIKVQHPLPLFISLGSLIGFGLMAFVISRFNILTFDSTIISLVQGLENPTLTAVMIFFTEIGSYKIIRYIAILFLIFLYVVFKQRIELFLVPIVFFGARMMNEYLKGIFQRERPDINRLIEIGGYSFPSGHAMNAMAFYGIVTFLVWKHISGRGKGAVTIFLGSLIIFMIGISRIFLGVHYPTDVIAGYFASGFFLAIAIWIYYIFKESVKKI